MSEGGRRGLQDLLERLGEALVDRSAMLVAAESCTGGGIARAATALPGSGSWFDRSFVTYSVEAKQEVLGIPAEFLERHGVISEETAAAMVKAARGNSRASLGVAVTGVAGPDSEEGKPVGTVCFAWWWRDRLRTETRLFHGDRESICDQSVEFAVRGALEMLELTSPRPSSS